MTVHDHSADEQLAQRGGDLVRAAARSVSAPLALRERIERERERARPAARRRHLRLGGALVGALAVAALVVGLVAPGGTPGAPTVVQAAQLGLRPATAPAPARDPAATGLVLAREGHVRFPYWAGESAWHPSGERMDSLDGRHATTVFYTAPGGIRLGYTVVGGRALPVPRGRVVAVGANRFVVLRQGRQVIVTWRNHGQTCILNAPDLVPAAALVALAQQDTGKA